MGASCTFVTQDGPRLAEVVETRDHSRQMRARIASGLQGLTGSSGTRAGDIWKKANQDLENSRGF